MKIEVERPTDARGERPPARFWIGRRTVEVVELRDRWPGRDHTYFELLGGDGATYVIRHDAETDSWELTMHLAPDAEALLAQVPHEGEPGRG